MQPRRTIRSQPATRLPRAPGGASLPQSGEALPGSRPNVNAAPLAEVNLSRRPRRPNWPAWPTSISNCPARAVYYFLTPRGEVAITAQAASNDLVDKLIYLAVALVAVVAISAFFRTARRQRLAVLLGPAPTC